MTREYVHEEMGSEIETISGHYSFIKEIRLPFQHREVLYLVGYAVVDRSCCGPGGCGFALVPGYIRSWKLKAHPDGRPVSAVEPITDPATRADLTRLIREREMIHQLEFW